VLGVVGGEIEIRQPDRTLLGNVALAAMQGDLGTRRTVFRPTRREWIGHEELRFGLAPEGNPSSTTRAAIGNL